MVPIPLTDIYPHHAEHWLVPAGTWRGRLLRKLLPRHLVLPLKFELHALKVRLHGREVVRRFRRADDLLVNIGCGGFGKPGWVNLDLVALEGVDCVYDCRTSLPFADASVRGIFCEHFFEHLDFVEEVPRFLAECRRVLKPAATIRLVVPDFERYLRAYVAGGWDELAELRSLDGERNDPHVGCRYGARMELVNVVFRQAHQHKFGYDFETLAVRLEEVGFRDVTRRSCGESRIPEICLDHPARAPESLYVEAVRAA